MIYSANEIDLEGLRKAAGLSQEMLAQRLGISQSMVSRYEQGKIEDVPFGAVREWQQLCGDLSFAQGMSLGKDRPYADIIAKWRLLRDYAAAAPGPLSDRGSGLGGLLNDPPTPARLVADVGRVIRKPLVAFMGPFDAGKSTVANAIMGGNRLGAGYQPTTSIICLVRSIDDRPAWMAEDVWILGRRDDDSARDFLDHADDEEFCASHKIVAGSYETLQMYGTHAGERKGRAAYFAMVYADSPVLAACDMLDTPGYGHSDADHEKAEFACRMADVLIYVSMADGFLGQRDLHYLSALVKQLPVIEGAGVPLPPLRNLYVLATKPFMGKDGAEQIIGKASRRAYHHLAETFNSHSAQEVTYDDFRQRVFPFLAEDPGMRASFERDFDALMGDIFPQIMRRTADETIGRLKAGATEYCEGWVAQLISMIENRSKSEEAVKRMNQAEPERRVRTERKGKAILARIADYRDETREFIDQTLAAMFATDNVEAIIKERYKDKKEAQAMAPSYLLEIAQLKLNAFLERRAQDLVPEIESLLEEFDSAANTVEFGREISVKTPFNARGAFLGAIAATGAAGGLAAWAAFAAAGSNLGGYILIPIVVSWLSSIGISVGGTAAVVHVVATVGGPVTIMIGLAVMAGMAVYALFGESWQARLSKRICQDIKKQNLFDEFKTHTDVFWEQTRTGFCMGLAKVERAFENNLLALEKLATSESRAEAERLLKVVKENRDFFAGIPWRATS